MKPIRVTYHAGLRLEQRMNTTRAKMLKIAAKAWREPTFKIVGNKIHKRFAGYDFVFATDDFWIHLISVVNPRALNNSRYLYDRA